LHVRNGHGTVVHSTIARNQTLYGILVELGATVELTNTILVSHTYGISVEVGSTATFACTLWGTGDWANGNDTVGGGTIATGSPNYWVDPGFRDPDNDDYHLAETSLAVDAGLNTPVRDDVDRGPRPHDGDGIGGAQPDIGADELAEMNYLPLVLRDY